MRAKAGMIGKDGKIKHRGKAKDFRKNPASDLGLKKLRKGWMKMPHAEAKQITENGCVLQLEEVEELAKERTEGWLEENLRGIEAE